MTAAQVDSHVLLVRLKDLPPSQYIAESLAQEVAAEYRQRIDLRMGKRSRGAALADVVIAATIAGSAAVLASLINAAVTLYCKHLDHQEGAPFRGDVKLHIDGRRKSRLITASRTTEIKEQLLLEIAEDCGEIVEFCLERSK